MNKMLEQIRECFSYEETLFLYNECYINFNLKNLILSGAMDAQFLSIKDFRIFPDVIECGWNWFNNQWLRNSESDKTILGKSIIENGTYYPIFLAPTVNDNRLHVMEGSHRIISLRMLEKQGIIDDNFKVFCLISPIDYYTYKKQQSEDRNYFSLYRNIMVDHFNFYELLTNKDLYDELIYNTKNVGDRIVGKCIKESYATSCFQVIDGMHHIADMLRHLHYLYKDIPPHRVINNEQEYKKWITS